MTRKFGTWKIEKKTKNYLSLYRTWSFTKRSGVYSSSESIFLEKEGKKWILKFNGVYRDGSKSDNYTKEFNSKLKAIDYIKKL